MLNSTGLKGAIVYYDGTSTCFDATLYKSDRNVGQHNDSRMNIALIMSAVKHGAIVANYCEVMQLNKGPNGKINGARVRDNLTGEEWNIRTKVHLLPLSLPSSSF